MTQAEIWIPARLGSTRLSEKLLRRAGGRPLLSYTIERAKEAAALLGREPRRAVRVVTDSDAIAAVAAEASVPALRVPERCRSGTDRLALAWRRLPQEERPGTVINLQGDEPLMPPRIIAGLARLMASRAEVAMGTVMRPGVREPGAVSVVVDRQDRALYFSRHPLPGRHPSRPSVEPAQARPAWGTHVGLYGYRGHLLERWLDWEQGQLEATEGLEQLRALEYGMTLAVLRADAVVDPDDRPWFSIDTEQDLRRFEARLEGGAVVGS